MNEVKLPALQGESPLGVLAALGVLRLLSAFTSASTYLRWDQSTLGAVVISPLSTLEEVVSEIHNIIADMPNSALLPGVPAGFPPPGAAPDRMRIPRDEFGKVFAAQLSGMSPEERQEAQLWLGSLVTDLAVDSGGRGAISQFAAPSGKQSMATMLEKPLELVRKQPDFIPQALTGWRRISGVTGEYLDHRALWDSTEDGSGAATMRGVPGATWLALMSYPLLRTTGSSRGRPASSGWHSVRHAVRMGTYEELRLPLWRQPLGTAAVTALLEHPTLDQDNLGKGGATVTPQLEALGVFRICRARRYQSPGGKSAGVLTPID